MKKMINMMLALCIVLSMAACGAGSNDRQAESGKQSASCYLDQGENAVIAMTVDLSGGWSVEFARGAAYLYDCEITEGNDSTAMLVTLEKEVYEENLAEAMADENRKEADGGVYFNYSENEGAFLTSVDDSAYALITSSNKEDIESIVSRITLSLDN